MSDRHKYAFNGEWFFENAREHIERDDFPHIPIGKVGGVNGWALGIYRHHLDNRQFPVFFFTLDQKPKFKICCYTSILKNDGSLSSVCNRYVESDSMVISISLILDEENRYLTNGGLKIEYGFQIEGILSSDNIWTFNFHDRLFDSEEKMNMITFYSGSKAVPMKLFHCHKQLLTFHSTYFDSDSNENQMIELTDSHGFHDFLQLSYGVRIQETSRSFYLDALEFAQKYKLLNVVHLVDEPWRSMDLTFSEAIEYGLNHRLTDSLRKIETLKKLTVELKKVDMKIMSGESMKKCVKRFFEFWIIDEDHSSSN